MNATRILGISTAILTLIILILWLSGLGGQALFWSFIKLNEPKGEFNPADAAEVPDYHLGLNWAALPTKTDPADLVPDGIEVAPQGEHAVDVFLSPPGFSHLE